MHEPIPAAPSEEYVIYCDIPTCPAQLSMVAGVSRSLHGWGRVSVYNDYRGPGLFGARDFDLCDVHLREVMGILGDENAGVALASAGDGADDGGHVPGTDSGV